MDILIQRIEELMKRKGINLRQLSIDSEIPYTTLKNFYIRGTDNVRLSTLRRIAEYFGLTLDELLGEENEGDQYDIDKILRNKNNEVLKSGKHIDDETRKKLIDVIDVLIR